MDSAISIINGGMDDGVVEGGEDRRAASSQNGLGRDLIPIRYRVSGRQARTNRTCPENYPDEATAYSSVHSSFLFVVMLCVFESCYCHLKSSSELVQITHISA